MAVRARKEEKGGAMTVDRFLEAIRRRDRQQGAVIFH